MEVLPHRRNVDEKSFMCLTCSLLFIAFFAYPEGFARQLLLVVQFSKSNLFFRFGSLVLPVH